MTEHFASDILADKHVLVTGGGSGLGLAMAGRFAALGAKITICGRRRGRLDEAVKTLAEIGGAVEAVRCDVKDAEAVEAAVSAAEDRQGPLTTLINNAAGNFLARTETLGARGFDAVVRTNLYGSFFMTQAAGRRWIERNTGGCVLSITTTYAATGSAYVIPSAASKAGIDAMTRSLATEWGRHGIRLNAIAPGPIPTRGAWERLIPDAEHEDAARRDIPLGRFATKDDLAELAVFLISDLSAFITGQVIALDGGQHLMTGLFDRMTQEDPAALTALFQSLRPTPRDD